MSGGNLYLPSCWHISPELLCLSLLLPSTLCCAFASSTSPGPAANPAVLTRVGFNPLLSPSSSLSKLKSQMQSKHLAASTSKPSCPSLVPCSGYCCLGLAPRLVHLLQVASISDARPQQPPQLQPPSAQLSSRWGGWRSGTKPQSHGLRCTLAVKGGNRKATALSNNCFHYSHLRHLPEKWEKRSGRGEEKKEKTHPNPKAPHLIDFLMETAVLSLAIY